MKKLKYFIILIFFIIVIILAPNIYYCKLGYSIDTSQTIKSETAFGDITSYSKTLDLIIDTSYYNKKYIKEYENINYNTSDNFFYYINAFLDKGYSASIINLIFNKLSDVDINFVINHDYINNLEDFLNISYFRKEHLERYINYFSLYPESTASNVVLFVNMNLDYDFYSNASLIDNPSDILALVNKYNYFDSLYVPSDLVDVPLSYGVRGQRLRSDALNNFITMAEAAKLEGVYIYVGSGYRSFEYQDKLYNNYVNLDGFENAERYSARAGFSEHQSGLAIDILNKNFTYISDGDIEYSWLLSNSYKYGFILRYPSGKENITGYMTEEWHYRYVGDSIATLIHNENITFDEYIAKK